MEANSTQVFTSFIQETCLTILSEISKGAFWFQVAALVISIILSLVVSKAIGHKLLAWESLFQEDTIKDKFWCFVLRLVSKLLFSVFAALFLSLQAYVIADKGLLPEHNFNLINIGYQVFYAWALLVLLMQVFESSRYLEQLRRPLYSLFWILAFLQIIGVLPKFIQAMREINLPIGTDSLTLWALFVGIFTVIVAIIVAQWLSNLCNSALASAKDIDDNFKIVLSRLINVAFIILAIIISLSSVGLDLTILSVFGGAIGVGLGFGLQKIASNYISGFIILFDHSVKIGDTVEVGGFNGKITQIKTRYSVLRNFSGEEMIIPNENFVTQNVKNFTFTDRASVSSIETSIGYECDLDRALAILVEVAKKQERILADPQPWAVMTGFGNDGLNLKLSFWVMDPERGTSVLRSTIMKEVLERFNEENISIPYTIRDVTLKGKLEIKTINDSSS